MIANTIAILGAGKLGVVLAQLAIKAGYDVYIAGSESPNKISLSMAVLAPGAIASSVDDAVSHASMVILAMPLGKYHEISPSLLDGKLVIDAMNYWWEVDGDREDLKNPTTSSSNQVQSYFYGSIVVKALSHMGYHHLSDGAKPKGDTSRKAIAIAGDSQAANQTVAVFVDNIGFDPLLIGPLITGKRLEPGHKAFGSNVSKEILRTLI